MSDTPKNIIETGQAEDTEALFNPKDINRLTGGGYTVRTKQYIVQGWRLFLTNPGPFLIYAAIVVGFNILVDIMPRATGAIGPITAIFIGAIFLFPFLMGIFIAAAKKMKGRETEFRDFFKGFDYFAPLSLAGIMVHAIIGAPMFAAYLLTINFQSFEYSLVSLALLILSVYCAVAYLFAGMLVIDRGMKPWQAMEASRKIITRNWGSFFILAAALLVFEVAGALLLIVGLIPATAINVCILTVAYDDVVGLTSTDF